jgi:uncharacterized protein YcaQ
VKPERISAARARRIALAAQGFARPRPAKPPGDALMRKTIDRLGLLQIDSVNVLVRAHYLPLFSRLGPYGAKRLDRLAYRGQRRALFEYWGHEASLLPIAAHPLMRWRMERAGRGGEMYKGIARFGQRNRKFLEAVLAEIAERGPISAAELTDAGRARGPWWGWSKGKRAIEWLFWAGKVTTATRRSTFERVYDVPERCLPPDVLALPTPAPEEAQRQLLLIAARALGVATERDLRDYFRLEVADTKARLRELVEAGALRPVEVEGWTHPGYLDPEARMPRRVDARALLSPFDPLVWERDRAERLFGFRYRIEIYTPAHKRVHGYYVLPFLLGERMAARVDLKAERAAGTLRVVAAHRESDADDTRVAPALAEELLLLAGWLGLERVVIAGRGDLAPALRRRLSGREAADDVPTVPADSVLAAS